MSDDDISMAAEALWSLNSIIRRPRNAIVAISWDVLFFTILPLLFPPTVESMDTNIIQSTCQTHLYTRNEKKSNIHQCSNRHLLKEEIHTHISFAKRENNPIILKYFPTNYINFGWIKIIFSGSHGCKYLHLFIQDFILFLKNKINK